MITRWEGRSWGDSTRSVHSGAPPAAPGDPLVPSPVLAAPYHLDPAGVGPGELGYGRSDNPTWTRLETAIGELEAGDCRVFASGQAAISAVLLTQLCPGDRVLLPADGYFSVRSFAASALASRGIGVDYVPTKGPYPDFSGYRVVLLESPANPGLDLADIKAIADAAHAAGALVAVDNTTATPLGQRPLELGADLVVASATKALSGHSDVLLGYGATRDPQLLTQLTQWRTHAGAIPGPLECWLLLRSLGTLALRLRQQSATARSVAALLKQHPAVHGVRWAGDSPLAAQLRIIPGLVSFELAGAAQVTQFLRQAKLVAAATSFGGLHTSADRREQWGDDVPPGFVRLSCGVEDTADLLADISAALAAIE